MTLVEEQSRQQEKIKPHTEFTLDYLDYNQREKIVKHLDAGKKLKCHHRKCEFFNVDFSTLYEYNMHCHSKHKRQPLHPELSLIKLLELEPRDNPWEPDSSSVTIIDNNNKSRSYQEVENGLDFLLLHFNQDRLFPRKIQTQKSKGKQIEVFSKEEAIKYFEQSYFVDCRINNFPSYTNYKGIQRYPPDSIFIDMDRSTFKDDKRFENALSKTLKNIKEKLNGYPTVNNSGNGYHIVLPIECPVLEQIDQFQKYKDNFFLSQEFLRFAEDFLSNDKADTNHYPSFKSCQIRVPGSINGKCLDNRNKRLLGNIKVKTIQEWNRVRAPITPEFVEEFRTYLEQKITDQENSNTNQHQKYSNIKNQSIEWIDKLLKTPITDFRKSCLSLILAPYVVNIKLSYQESFDILIGWLHICDSIRKLDFNPFYLVNTAIKTAIQKRIPPMKQTTLKNKNLELYHILEKIEYHEGT
ncbi:MAG TPA: hypothetical protein VFK40_08095 [Nitrososphaeraceae archaeon]|nr:hypothetical protein [Nitrososphaeraceae archaeon]